MKPRSHLFEGEQRTVREICAMVPCLSSFTVRNYLKAGMTTRQQMTSKDYIRARIEGGRRGAAVVRKQR